MTKTEKIEELKNVLKLALELAEPNHECEKCSLKEQCKEKYSKLLEKECGEDILKEVDDEFCYPIVDGDEKDCLIRTRIKELLKKD